MCRRFSIAFIAFPLGLSMLSVKHRRVKGDMQDVQSYKAVYCLTRPFWLVQSGHYCWANPSSTHHPSHCMLMFQHLLYSTFYLSQTKYEIPSVALLSPSFSECFQFLVFLPCLVVFYFPYILHPKHSPPHYLPVITLFMAMLAVGYRLIPGLSIHIYIWGRQIRDKLGW